MKADLREYTISKTSPMPSYKGTLSDGGDGRRARLSAFAERTVAMTERRTYALLRVVLRIADRPAVLPRAWRR